MIVEQLQCGIACEFFVDQIDNRIFQNLVHDTIELFSK